mmetsp:Transcript_33316/g.33925  ORF Transcript_33316/g.33925 Transcript_33316/m.33925 type:complete len:333 (-) Transcript_33316:133-1131(-)
MIKCLVSFFYLIHFIFDRSRASFPPNLITLNLFAAVKYGSSGKRSNDSKKEIFSRSRRNTSKKTDARSPPSSKIIPNTFQSDLILKKEAINYARKTIWGQNIVNIRSFNIDSKKTFQFLGSFTSSVPIYPSAEICFLGRSNVGKSSLLNCLTGLNKKVAVESKTPGRTREINLFQCSDSIGPLCLFVDLPGYGYAKMGKELQSNINEFVRNYLHERGSLRLAVVLLDPRRVPQESDRGMIEYLREIELPFIVVATKTDKLSKNELQNSLNMIRRDFSLPSDQPIIFSATTGNGKKQLWHSIQKGLLGELDTDTEKEEEEKEEDGMEGENNMN